MKLEDTLAANARKSIEVASLIESQRLQIRMLIRRQTAILNLHVPGKVRAQRKCTECCFPFPCDTRKILLGIGEK